MRGHGMAEMRGRAKRGLSFCAVASPFSHLQTVRRRCAPPRLPPFRPVLVSGAERERRKDEGGRFKAMKEEATHEHEQPTNPRRAWVEENGCGFVPACGGAVAGQLADPSRLPRPILLARGTTASSPATRRRELSPTADSSHTPLSPFSLAREINIEIPPQPQCSAPIGGGSDGPKSTTVPPVIARNETVARQGWRARERRP